MENILVKRYVSAAPNRENEDMLIVTHKMIKHYYTDMDSATAVSSPEVRAAEALNATWFRAQVKRHILAESGVDPDMDYIHALIDAAVRMGYFSIMSAGEMRELNLNRVTHLKMAPRARAMALASKVPFVNFAADNLANPGETAKTFIGHFEAPGLDFGLNAIGQVIPGAVRKIDYKSYMRT